MNLPLKHGAVSTCVLHIAMRKIVLDTNCLLQSLPSKSPYHNVWEGVLDGSVVLCVNTEILNEYEEILSIKTNPEIAKNVVEAIARLATTYSILCRNRNVIGTFFISMTNKNIGYRLIAVGAVILQPVKAIINSGCCRIEDE